VALLALIAGQDVEPIEGSDGTDGQWRIAWKVAPDRVISTVDPDTRHVHKTVHRRQDGYKAHLAVEPDTGIITDCALTKANGADNHEAAVGLQLLEGEDSPVTVLADSAYGAGDFRAELDQRGHADRVKPAPNRRTIPGGFTSDDFTVDHAGRTATCPNGLIRPISRAGWATFGAGCAPARCGPAALAAVTAKLFGLALMTSGYVRPARPPATRSGWPSTASTVPWSNERSPG
jgi:Transposase DDE domain